MKQKWLWAGGALLLLIAAWSGVDMWRLFQQDLLWGYRPLVFFLASWLGIILLAQAWKNRSTDTGSLQRLAFSSLSGLLLGVGFPDILPLPFLLFFAWVPLLILEQHLADQGTQRKRVFLGHVFHTAMVWNILSTYWVGNTAFFAGLFAITANSFLMTLPFLLFLYVKRQMPRLAYPAIVCFWICFEYMHLHWELTWPWLMMGNGLAEVPALIQWYEYTGVFGGTLLIWILNILFLRAYQASQAGEAARGYIIRAGLLILLPAVFSLIRYSTYVEEGDTIDVVVVQPNYEPHYLKFTEPESSQVTRFLELSLSQLDEEVDYLVFPETSFGYLEEAEVFNYPATSTLRRELAALPNLKVITGLNAYHDFGPNEERTDATRQRQTRDGRTVDFEVLNLAAQLPIDPNQAPQTYRKSKLVPGPENFPFKEILFFMEPIVEQLDGTTAGLGTQEKRETFTSNTANIAPAICYESVFGQYYASYVREGQAQAGFIMTNDGWWDNTAGHRQHLLFAGLRAIETRRPIARSANTGISAFINQRGDILQATQYDEPAAIRGELVLNDQLTFYIKWGDIIARIALFTSIIFVLNVFVKGRIGEKE